MSIKMSTFLYIRVLVIALVGTIASISATTPIPAKRYTVNLDEPERLHFYDMAADYADVLKAIVNELVSEFESKYPVLVALVDKYGGDLLIKRIRSPYANEMKGISEASGIPLGRVILANYIYEFTAYEKMCAGILAEDTSGTIYHGRNLDYSKNLADYLRALTVIVDFQQGGETVYTGTIFVGTVGLLTGQKPYGYTITLNQRDQGHPLGNLYRALVLGSDGVVNFLIRDVLAGDYTFETAVNKLAHTPLIAPCYLIVGGTTSGQGTVITREGKKHTSSLDVWYLNAEEEGRWFLVQTNDDHWEPPYDDRRDAAIEEMNEIGQDNINAPALFNVLSTPPVLRVNSTSSTIYTSTMSAAIPELYNTWVRSDD